MKGKLLLFIFTIAMSLLKAQENTVISVIRKKPFENIKPISAVDSIKEIPTPTVKLNGFVDAYYSYDLANPNENQKPGFFYNHTRHDEFSLNMALIQMKYNSEKTRASIGLMTGTYAQYNLAHEQDLMRNIYEASAGVELVKDLWLDAGVFGSHLGFESAISSENITLTRSIMAESSPYYLSGAKLTYSGIEKWTIMTVVSNGWQNISENFFNENKAIGTQVIFEPSDKILINYSTMISDEGTISFPEPRLFTDIYVVMKPTKKLKVITAFDYGVIKAFSWMPGRANYWYAPAALVGYDWSDKLSTGVRAEYYVDEGGIIIQPDFKVFGASLNMDYKPTKNAVLRIEGKWLYSENKIFERENRSLHSDNIAITTSLAVTFGN